MTRNQMEQEFQMHIEFERRVKRVALPETAISKTQYEIMVTWILEHLDDLECHKSTKYLAKTYLDVYLSQQTHVPDESLQLLAISVARLSVKFNQSQEYPVGFAEKIGNFRYLSEEFIKMENDLLVAMSFNLNFVTPHHYIPLITHLIPQDQQIYKELDQLIDFCCTCIEWATLSAGEMVLACFLYLAYCHDPEKISIIKAYGQRFPNMEAIVVALDRKASQEVDCNESSS